MTKKKNGATKPKPRPKPKPKPALEPGDVSQAWERGEEFATEPDESEAIEEDDPGGDNE